MTTRTHLHTHKTPIAQLCIFACKYWAHFYPHTKGNTVIIDEYERIQLHEKLLRVCESWRMEQKMRKHLLLLKPPGCPSHLRAREPIEMGSPEDKESVSLRGILDLITPEIRDTLYKDARKNVEEFLEQAHAQMEAQYTDQQLTEMRDRQACLQSLEENSPT